MSHVWLIILRFWGTCECISASSRHNKLRHDDKSWAALIRDFSEGKTPTGFIYFTCITGICNLRESLNIFQIDLWWNVYPNRRISPLKSDRKVFYLLLLTKTLDVRGGRHFLVLSPFTWPWTISQLILQQVFPVNIHIYFYSYSSNYSLHKSMNFSIDCSLN